MSFNLLQLPEELLMHVFEIAASLHQPSMRPRRPGFQSLLEESSVSALSLTCKRIRRLVLPILFRSIRITPGFIHENLSNARVRSPDMQPFVDGLRNSGSWKLHCVRHLSITNTGRDLKVFVLDLLGLFTALERVEVPNRIWDHPEVLQAIHSHPTLRTCKFPSVPLCEPELLSQGQSPQVELHKIVSRSSIIASDRVIPILQQQLEAGVMIEELWSRCASTSWTYFQFPTNLTSIRISETLDDMNSFWALISNHPSIQVLSLKGEGIPPLRLSNSFRLIEKVAPQAATVLEEGLSCSVSSIVIKKENGTWLIKDVEVEFECGEGEGLVEGFCSKVQRLGSVFNGLKSLFLTTAKWDKNRKLESPSIEDIFARALSTYTQLKHFSMRLPEGLTSYIEENIHLLGLDSRYRGSTEHVYRRATFRIAHRIALAAHSIEQVNFSGIPWDMNSVTNGWTTNHVIVQRNNADVKVFRGEMQYGKPEGQERMVVVGDAWFPSEL